MVRASYVKTYLSSDSQGGLKENSLSNKNPESASLYAPRINPAIYGSGRVRATDTQSSARPQTLRASWLPGAFEPSLSCPERKNRLVALRNITGIEARPRRQHTGRRNKESALDVGRPHANLVPLTRIRLKGLGPVGLTKTREYMGP